MMMISAALFSRLEVLPLPVIEKNNGGVSPSIAALVDPAQPTVWRIACSAYNKQILPDAPHSVTKGRLIYEGLED